MRMTKLTRSMPQSWLAGALLICATAMILVQSAHADSSKQPSPSGKDESVGLPPGQPPLPSFISTVKGQSLSPDEIIELKKLLDGQQKAEAATETTPSMPDLRIVNVDLSPGGTPPVVRISGAQGSVLTFLDAEGKPWPISGIANFTKKLFDAEIPIKNGHLISISPKKEFGMGNMAVFLKDLPSPITLTILAGQNLVDYRVDFRIPKLIGDKSILPEKVSPTVDPIMLSVLSDTVSSADARQIKVSPEESGVEAWEKASDKEKTLLIRTAGVLLSPAPIAGKKATSADGTNAYECPLTPVVTLLLNGKATDITLDVN